MRTASQKKPSLAPNAQASTRKAPSIKHQPKAKHYYFDVGLGSVCLSGMDTEGAYCLIEVRLAPGAGVPRHMHTGEDEVYFILAGELEVTVAEKVFVLRPGDTLFSPARHHSQIAQFRQHHESLPPRVLTFRLRGVHHGDGPSRA